MSTNGTVVKLPYRAGGRRVQKTLTNDKSHCTDKIWSRNIWG